MKKKEMAFFLRKIIEKNSDSRKKQMKNAPLLSHAFVHAGAVCIGNNRSSFELFFPGLLFVLQRHTRYLVFLLAQRGLVPGTIIIIAGLLMDAVRSAHGAAAATRDRSTPPPPTLCP